MIGGLGIFTLLGKTSGAGLPQYKWRNNQSGETIDGSSIPVVEAHFKTLCPTAIAPDAAIFDFSSCARVSEMHGFLYRSQVRCGFKYYSFQVAEEIQTCAKVFAKDEVNELMISGMQMFDQDEKKRGRAQACRDVLHEFPKLIKK